MGLRIIEVSLPAIICFLPAVLNFAQNSWHFIMNFLFLSAFTVISALWLISIIIDSSLFSSFIKCQKCEKQFSITQVDNAEKKKLCVFCRLDTRTLP